MKSLTRNIIFKLLLCCFMLPLILHAASGDFPERPNPPKAVNDLAGFMSPQEQHSLELTLDSFERATTIAVTIVTLKSLGEYDASEYTFELGNKWGVGRGKEDNGVVILASKDDRKWYIATGYGLEAAIPDGLAGRIGREQMVPEFKTGNYYLGFKKAVDAILAASKGEYANNEVNNNPSEDGASTLLSAFIFFIILIVIIIIISKKGGGGGGGRYMSRRGSDFVSGAILGNILGGGGFGGGSGGGFGGGSSGGFGGFGGGGFGGGGAGGSW